MEADLDFYYLIPDPRRVVLDLYYTAEYRFLRR